MTGVPTSQRGRVGFKLSYGGKNLYMFDPKLKALYKGDDGLRGWSRKPSDLAVSLGLMFDMPLHVFSLRFLVGRYFQMMAIELPQIVDKMVLERAKLARSKIDGERSGIGPLFDLPPDVDSVFECTKEALSPALRRKDQTLFKGKDGKTYYKFAQASLSTPSLLFPSREPALCTGKRT